MTHPYIQLTNVQLLPAASMALESTQEPESLRVGVRGQMHGAYHANEERAYFPEDMEHELSEEEDEILFDTTVFGEQVIYAPPVPAQVPHEPGTDEEASRVQNFDFLPFFGGNDEVERPVQLTEDALSDVESEDAALVLQVESIAHSQEDADNQDVSDSESVASSLDSADKPVTTDSQVALHKHGKKNRQPIKSMPLRVWIPGGNKGSWTSIDELNGRVKDKLTKAFDQVVLKPAKHKNLWARWQDPINRAIHYNQCISHGITAKSGKRYASNHEACEWCVKRGLPCALIHQAQVDFIGILSLADELRVGQSVDDIEFWLSR
jgi:hypothetical protein